MPFILLKSLGLKFLISVTYFDHLHLRKIFVKTTQFMSNVFSLILCRKSGSVDALWPTLPAAAEKHHTSQSWPGLGSNSTPMDKLFKLPEPQLSYF